MFDNVVFCVAEFVDDGDESAAQVSQILHRVFVCVFDPRVVSGIKERIEESHEEPAVFGERLRDGGQIEIELNIGR